jgi:hypothetical protein
MIAFIGSAKSGRFKWFMSMASKKDANSPAFSSILKPCF